MARLTVFGAGAMGTALAMHAARRGLDVALWANPFDERALSSMRAEGLHPALQDHLPGELAVFGPDQLAAAAEGCETAVLAASSAGARSLAGMVGGAIADARHLVSVAKGLDPGSGWRISEVYAEAIPGPTVVAVGGPCLASELAAGLPTVSVWASARREDARAAGEPLADGRYQLVFTDDLVGVEFCAVAKNVAAIGIGLLDGVGKLDDRRYRNATAALLTKAVTELSALVVALGGREETAMGPAGLGDILVTSVGGRNRLFGELVGAGRHPDQVVHEMEDQGLTVEGRDAAAAVAKLAEQAGLDLPYHRSVHRVLFEDADPRSLMEVLR